MNKVDFSVLKRVSDPSELVGKTVAAYYTGSCDMGRILYSGSDYTCFIFTDGTYFLERSTAGDGRDETAIEWVSNDRWGDAAREAIERHINNSVSV